MSKDSSKNASPEPVVQGGLDESLRALTQQLLVDKDGDGIADVLKDAQLHTTVDGQVMHRTIIQGPQVFILNGKTYKSLDELPPGYEDLKAHFAQLQRQLDTPATEFPPPKVTPSAWEPAPGAVSNDDFYRLWLKAWPVTKIILVVVVIGITSVKLFSLLRLFSHKL